MAIAAGGGMSHESIASALGVARGTLEKHFDNELAQGAGKRRMEAMCAMYEAAIKGNVAAMKAFLAKQPEYAPLPAPKPERLGKKEQAANDAITSHLGTGWEADLKPRGKAH